MGAAWRMQCDDADDYYDEELHACVAISWGTDSVYQIYGNAAVVCSHVDQKQY